MNKIKIYHSLPYPFKVIGASLHGCTLRRWRYGSGTEDLVEEILERDKWSMVQWKAWQEERLAFLLDRAATKVPYYRAQWDLRRRQGDRSSWNILENWPILTKAKVFHAPEAFIAEDYDPKKMYIDHTGGTTGTPLKIYESRQTIRQWYAMYEARIRRWNKVTYRDHWAILGGQMVIPLEQTKPPYWVRNFGMNQLYLSTFHISKSNVIEYVKKINSYQPTHLVVYPSSAINLAQEILAQNLSVWKPQVIISNAEPLSINQRMIISTAFGCPVVNSYGMGEIALGASECDHNQMHFWPDAGILEVVDDHHFPCKNGTSGNFFATGLINQDMPLIRYAVGDRGRKYQFGECKCGRKLPVMSEIEGRSSDLIQTPDGRKIFWLNPVFYDLPILEAQIIQESLWILRVKLVTQKNFTTMDSQTLEKRLQQRLGNHVKVVIEIVDFISRGKNGKFKSVISEVHT